MKFHIDASNLQRTELAERIPLGEITLKYFTAKRKSFQGLRFEKSGQNCRIYNDV
jgi:hypothetical protein